MNEEHLEHSCTVCLSMPALTFCLGMHATKEFPDAREREGGSEREKKRENEGGRERKGEREGEIGREREKERESERD